MQCVNLEHEDPMHNATDRRAHYTTAYRLAVITVLYNIIEGVLSVWLGAQDETLSLFGFGVDSFVEVISGIGIWHMVRRIRSPRGRLPGRLRATGAPHHRLCLLCAGGGTGGLRPAVSLTAAQASVDTVGRDRLPWFHVIHVAAHPAQDPGWARLSGRRPSWPMRPVPGLACTCRSRSSSQAPVIP